MCWILFLCCLQRAYGTPKQFLSKEVVRKIDLNLIESCGGECVNTFHTLLPEIEKYFDDPKGFLSLLKSIDETFQKDLRFITDKKHEFEELIATSFRDKEKQRKSIAEHKRLPDNNQSQSVQKEAEGPDGTACWSAKACKELTAKANECTQTRIMTLKIYENTNIMLHALQSVLRVSCACLFDGPVTVCALSGFPYTCSIFNAGYRALFSTSQSLYSISGSLVATCGMLSGIVSVIFVTLMQ
jgi:hypothetical protein